MSSGVGSDQLKTACAGTSKEQECDLHEVHDIPFQCPIIIGACANKQVASLTKNTCMRQ